MKKPTLSYGGMSITLEIIAPSGRKYLEKFKVTLKPQEATIEEAEGCKTDIRIRFEYSLAFHIDGKVADFFTNRGWTGKWKAYSGEVSVGGKVYASTDFSFIGNMFMMIV